MNNEAGTIKGRVDAKLYTALKAILNRLELTQQDFIEMKVKEFIIDNIDLMFKSDSK